MVKKLKLEQLTIKPKNIEKLVTIFYFSKFFCKYKKNFLQIHGPTWDTSIKKFPRNYKKNFLTTMKRISLQL